MTDNYDFTLKAVDDEGNVKEDGTFSDGATPSNAISVSGTDVTAYIQTPGAGQGFGFYLKGSYWEPWGTTICENHQWFLNQQNPTERGYCVLGGYYSLSNSQLICDSVEEKPSVVGDEPNSPRFADAPANITAIKFGFSEAQVISTDNSYPNGEVQTAVRAPGISIHLYNDGDEEVAFYVALHQNVNTSVWNDDSGRQLQKYDVSSSFPGGVGEGVFNIADYPSQSGSTLDPILYVDIRFYSPPSNFFATLFPRFKYKCDYIDFTTS